MRTSKEQNKRIDGMDLLRNLVNDFGWRDEHLNTDKTPDELVKEYLDYINDKTDLDGNKLEE